MSTIRTYLLYTGLASERGSERTSIATQNHPMCPWDKWGARGIFWRHIFFFFCCCSCCFFLLELDLSTSETGRDIDIREFQSAAIFPRSFFFSFWREIIMVPRINSAKIWESKTTESFKLASYLRENFCLNEDIHLGQEKSVLKPQMIIVPIIVQKLLKIRKLGRWFSGWLVSCMAANPARFKLGRKSSHATRTRVSQWHESDKKSSTTSYSYGYSYSERCWSLFSALV